MSEKNMSVKIGFLIKQRGYGNAPEEERVSRLHEIVLLLEKDLAFVPAPVHNEDMKVKENAL